MGRHVDAPFTIRHGYFVEIDGEPAAMAQANLVLSGARDGVDGTYIIKAARHRYARRHGWTTTCEVEQPSGSAGTDSRAPDGGEPSGDAGGSGSGNVPASS